MLSVKKRGINKDRDEKYVIPNAVRDLHEKDPHHGDPSLAQDDMRLIFILFKGILSALL